MEEEWPGKNNTIQRTNLVAQIIKVKDKTLFFFKINILFMFFEKGKYFFNKNVRRKEKSQYI